MQDRIARHGARTPLEQHVLGVSHDAITEAKRLELRMQRRFAYAALAVLALVCLVLVLA